MFPSMSNKQSIIIIDSISDWVKSDHGIVRWTWAEGWSRSEPEMCPRNGLGFERNTIRRDLRFWENRSHIGVKKSTGENDHHGLNIQGKPIEKHGIERKPIHTITMDFTNEIEQIARVLEIGHVPYCFLSYSDVFQISGMYCEDFCPIIPKPILWQPIICVFQKDDFGKVSEREITGSGTVAGEFRGHQVANDYRSLLDEISRQALVLVSLSDRSCVKSFGIENEKAHPQRSQDFLLWL
jgi:hypothetical protein